MATPTASTKTAPATDIPATAQKLREQLVSAVRQGQQFSVDAAQTFAQAVSVLPVIELPTVPGLPAMPGVESATRYTFDVATDLLTAQRDFALKLANVLAPAKSV